VKKSKRLFKKECYRYTVEILEIASAEKRLLPLEVWAVIAFLPRKRGSTVQPYVPNRQQLRLQDGAEVLEADDLDQLRVVLRTKYPDERFERRLHVQRDREAEERREAALQNLAEIFMRAAVDHVIEEMEQEKVSAVEVQSEGEYRD
jgi:hypothetical protein